jgi:glycosyltransferase involved in cell wall biosynthesis
MRILALISDAFGGHGGIAKFNRDLLTALCADACVQDVNALPRHVPEPPGVLPNKLNYIVKAARGKLRYTVAALISTFRVPRSTLILCGHIHLLPIAFLVRLLLRQRSPLRAPCPVLLIIHGIDAWQPTRSRLLNWLVRRIDGFVSVSETTRERFLKWAKPNGARSFILPNCVDLAQFTPGPKHPALLEKYGLRDRKILLTVARLSAQERYKGIDEVMETLPELAKTIPNISYLIVGDGTDRERLVKKAKFLGLRVEESGERRAECGNEKSESESRKSVIGDRESDVSVSAFRVPQAAFPTPSVIFAGRIGDVEKVEYYRLADAFVMPGRGEGFGIVYLEAMACGLPIVASKADASREIVDDESGVVVDPQNPAEIIAGILRTLQRPAGTIPQRVRHYSFEKFQERTQAIFQTLGQSAVVAG